MSQRLERIMDGAIKGHLHLPRVHQHYYYGWKPIYVHYLFNGYTLLMHAAQHGRVEVVRFLLDEGADVNRSVGWHTALLEASERGHVKVVQLLLEQGAEMGPGTNDQGPPPPRFGRTALHVAAGEGHAEVLRVLLRHSTAAIDDRYGWRLRTPLHVSCRDGGWRHEAIVPALLAAGADPTIADEEGQTPLSLAREACSRGHFSMQAMALLQVRRCGAGLRHCLLRVLSRHGTRRRGRSSTSSTRSGASATTWLRSGCSVELPPQGCCVPPSTGLTTWPPPSAALPPSSAAAASRRRCSSAPLSTWFGA